MKTFFLWQYIILCLINSKVSAQSAISPNGGTIKNASGSVSYTVGITSYKNFKNNYKASEGIQQPNTIYEVLNAQELQNDQVKVYPNPTSDILNIIKKKSSDNLSYEIYDGNGKLLQRSIINNYQINLTAYPAGLYIIKLFDENSANTIKILKK
ncbi:MAG TPA: hypothetical protein DCP54_10640 [Chryseobacterium sp.]|nr:hypothetical protein [Chryseobacterium sp.]